MRFVPRPDEGRALCLSLATLGALIFIPFDDSSAQDYDPWESPGDPARYSLILEWPPYGKITGSLDEKVLFLKPNQIVFEKFIIEEPVLSEEAPGFSALALALLIGGIVVLISFMAFLLKKALFKKKPS